MSQMYDPEQYEKPAPNGNETEEPNRTRRNRSRSRSPVRQTRSRSRSRSPREWKRSEKSRDRDRSGDRNGNRDREHRRGGRDSRVRLYVCNMPYDTRWQDLKDLFREKVGNDVVHVEMYKDHSGKQCGAAAIEVRSEEVADKAIDILHKYEIKERQIIVRIERDKDRWRHQGGGGGGGGMSDMGGGGGGGGSMRGGGIMGQGGDGHGGNMGNMGGNMGMGGGGGGNSNMGGGSSLVSNQLLNQLGIDPNRITNQVFVANLDYKVTSNKLKEIFAMAGNVVQGEIKEDDDRKSRGLGTVHFQHPMEAVQAISMFNGQVLYDRPMSVRLDKMGTAVMPQQIPSKLPVGLKGVGMGLGAGGAPLQNIAQLVGTLGSLGNLASSIGSLSSLGGGMGGNLGGNQGLGLLSSLSNLGSGGGNMGGGNLGSSLNSLNSQMGGMGSSGLGQQSLSSLGALGGSLGNSQLGGLSSLGGGLGGNSGGGSMSSMAGGGGISNLASSLNSLAQSFGGGGGVGSSSLGSQFNSSDLSSLGASGGLSRSLATLGGDSSMGGSLAGLGALQGSNLSSLMGSGGMGGSIGGDDRDMGGMNYSNRGSRMDSHMDNRMSNASRTVCVKNLPYTVTWQELREKFQECGEVKFAEIKLEMGRSKGQGTVRFNTAEEAKRAADRMHGARVGGRDLVVRLEA